MFQLSAAHGGSDLQRPAIETGTMMDFFTSWLLLSDKRKSVNLLQMLYLKHAPANAVFRGFEGRIVQDESLENTQIRPDLRLVFGWLRQID